MRQLGKATRLLGALGALAWLGGCGDDHPTGAGRRGIELPASAVLVSDAAGTLRPSLAGSGVAAALGSWDSVTYVSLVPGTVTRGSSVEIRNVTTGFTRSEPLVAGGLDPVAVPAGVGDVVELTISDGSEVTAHARVVVGPRRPPRVVRTEPPPKKRDVVLNARIMVVFSEPMDPKTITTATLRLLTDTTPVAGFVELSSDGLRADFTPAELLGRSTGYTLVVAGAVADLSGDVLGEPVAVDFTTGNQSGASPVASVMITPGTADLVWFLGDSQPSFAGQVFGPPGGVSLTASSRDASGAELTGSTVVWSSSNPSVARVTQYVPGASARVEIVAPGRATITATVDGIRGTAGIRVLTATVQPATATLQVGDTRRIIATVRDSAGTVQTGWTMGWSSRRNVVDVGWNSGLVTALAPGIELVTVTFQHAALFGIGLGGSAFARITVGSGGPLASIVVTPDTVRTVPLAQVVLRATVRDANGTITYAPLSWSISPQQCGPFSCNSVEPDLTVWDEGLVFMNEQAGTYTITATAGSRSATSTVISDYIRVAAVSSQNGSNDFCALTPGGEAYCRGPGAASGYGIVYSSRSFGYAGPVAVTGGLTFSALSSGPSHRCALTATGAAFCWGSNSNSQLGTAASLQDCDRDARSSSLCSPSPVPVAGGLNFVRITSASSHTCALTAGGAAYCWGYNGQGQLGDGTTSDRSTPVAVTGGLSFAEVGAGIYHTCALTGGGLAYCWGGNYDGQLGSGSTTDSYTPEAVAGGLTFTRIAAGGNHTCALTTAGTAYCWGGTYRSVFGADRPMPIPMPPGLTFREIGGSGGCGLTATGAVYCWGFYDPTPDDYEDDPVFVEPTLVPGGHVFGSLSADGVSSCGITTGGVAYCWQFLGTPVKLWGQR